MGRSYFKSYCFFLLLWLPGKIAAQRVIYSETFKARPSTTVTMIGNTDDHYWVEKRFKTKPSRNYSNDETVSQNISLLDSKLNPLDEISTIIPSGAIKQWLVAGPAGMDQVFAVRAGGQTNIIRNHLAVETQLRSELHPVISVPFISGPSRLILTRSEDQSKILLLAFEHSNDESVRLHMLLMNADWSPIYQQAVSNEMISQPCIQDDEIGFVSESFDNLPIKLMNNGEWLMAFSSRVSLNFTLFHVCPNGSDYSFREIPLAPYYKMEDVAMSVNIEQDEMSVGFLSSYRKSSLKCVQVCNYSINEGRFHADTSYRFTTKPGAAVSGRLSHESFIAMPHGGFMLLKEYGTPLDSYHQSPPLLNPFETAYLLADYKAPGTKDGVNQGYTLNSGLSPIPFIRNRGDLNLFYFPSASGDSTWSGILDMEQRSELNNPDLSYLMIPNADKMYIIYNDVSAFTDPVATSTTLNTRGEATDDPLVFWEIKKMLNFQLSRRFSRNAVAVPYPDRKGFAIIRFGTMN